MNPFPTIFAVRISKTFNRPERALFTVIFLFVLALGLSVSPRSGVCVEKAAPADQAEERPLEKELGERSKAMTKMAPKDKIEMHRNAIEDLRKSGIMKTALKVGDKAPEFKLPGVSGKDASLYDLLKKGPVVLAFYRGGWCPYCNTQLRAYQKALPDFKAAGGTLVAVSPQTPDKSLSLAEKSQIEFEVLSDAGNKVAKSFGIAFKLPEDIKEAYKGFGADLKDWNGDEEYELPVPAAYVIDRDGIIRYAFIDPDYAKRAEPSEILSALKKLKK